MIGVISKEGEEGIVREFFELFKVPWEFYKENRSYPVVLSTHDSLKELDARLILLYRSDKIKFDVEHKINVTTSPNSPVLSEYKGSQFPIYGKILTFDT